MEGAEIVLYTSGIMNIGATNKAISANSFMPIAAAVVSAQDEENGFGTALMLSVAFCATIGGMGSLIGTPPNAIFAAYVGTTYDVAISRQGYRCLALQLRLQKSPLYNAAERAIFPFAYTGASGTRVGTVCTAP